MNIGNVLTSMLVHGTDIDHIPKSDGAEVFDVDYIVQHKPGVNKVRQFMRVNLESIKSAEEIMFDKK